MEPQDLEEIKQPQELGKGQYLINEEQDNDFVYKEMKNVRPDILACDSSKKLKKFMN